MSEISSLIKSLKVEPLQLSNWNSFEELFGDRGACGNCWCMSFRLKKSLFDQGKQNNGNKNAMKKIVEAGLPAGLMGMIDGKAIAWCAFAPREDFVRLGNSRIHKPVDDLPVWSLPCFFISKKYRHQGLSLEFLKKVIEYARKQKIGIIEAYPVIPKDRLPDAFAWVGLYRTFERAGFEIASQVSVNHPMVRYYIR